MISASALWRIEKCPASASLPQVQTLTAASERGSAMHAEMEQAEPDGAEVAFAYNPETGVGRELGRGLKRAYGDLADGEIAGTTDKVLVEADRVVIRDYKSGAGYNVAAPADNLQLAFYALAACSAYGRTAARVEIDFIDKDRTPGADLDVFDLAAARERIRAIVQAAKTPTTRTGDHCSGCPCIVNCPAHLTMAIAFNEGIWPDVMPADGLTVERVAQGWEHLKSAKRVLGLVERTYRAFASQWPVQLGGGTVLAEHEVERESLDGPVTFQVLRDLHGEPVARAALEMDATKASVERALAPIAPPRGKAKLVRDALAAVAAANGVRVVKKRVVEEFKQEE